MINLNIFCSWETVLDPSQKALLIAFRIRHGWASFLHGLGPLASIYTSKQKYAGYRWIIKAKAVDKCLQILGWQLDDNSVGDPWCMRYEGLALQCHPDPTPQDDALARSKMQQTDKKMPGTAFAWIHGREAEIWILRPLAARLPILMPKFWKMNPSVLFASKTVDNHPSHRKQCGSIHSCEHEEKLSRIGMSHNLASSGHV